LQDLFIGQRLAFNELGNEFFDHAAILRERGGGRNSKIQEMGWRLLWRIQSIVLGGNNLGIRERERRNSSCPCWHAERRHWKSARGLDASPGRFAPWGSSRTRGSVLECGGPPPLSRISRAKLRRFRRDW